jgi:uncharacterized protein (DUF1499 family)
MLAVYAEAGSEKEPDKSSLCPDSPNCVSSQSSDKAHFIEQLYYTGNLADTRQKLINVLENEKRVHLAKVDMNYIHAEFRSPIFRFVDDVKFWFPPDKPIIHVTSASPTGYYDFGANRRRVERLRVMLEKMM